MKMINLGAGSNILPPPWENYDADLDITKPLPFADGSVDMILAEHVVEHTLMGDALKFMIEGHRVLRQYGVLRICVPSIERLEIAHGRDIVWGHGHLGVYTKDTLHHMLRLAGFDECDITWGNVNECDGHWRVIGKEKDDLETLRMEATKL